MSECRGFRRQLVDYLDGANPNVARHIESCASCRAELETLRLSRDALDSVRKLETPQSMWARVEQRLRSIEEERSWAWRLISRKPAYAFAAGTVLLVLGAASLLISPQGHVPQFVLILVSPFSPVGISAHSG